MWSLLIIAVGGHGIWERSRAWQSIVVGGQGNPLEARQQDAVTHNPNSWRRAKDRLGSRRMRYTVGGRTK